MSCVEVQVKIIAGLELIISILLLLLNIKILLQVCFWKDDRDELQDYPHLTDSSLITFFLVRVIYLTAELVLAIVLNISARKPSYDGLLLWMIVTPTLTIVSRCYFIGGFTWGKYFIITIVIFSVNLTFTAYSLTVVYFLMKHINNTRRVERQESLSNYYEMRKLHQQNV